MPNFIKLRFREIHDLRLPYSLLLGRPLITRSLVLSEPSSEFDVISEVSSSVFQVTIL